VSAGKSLFGFVAEPGLQTSLPLLRFTHARIAARSSKRLVLAMLIKKRARRRAGDGSPARVCTRCMHHRERKRASERARERERERECVGNGVESRLPSTRYLYSEMLERPRIRRSITRRDHYARPTNVRERILRLDSAACRFSRRRSKRNAALGIRAPVISRMGRLARARARAPRRTRPRL